MYQSMKKLVALLALAVFVLTTATMGLADTDEFAFSLTAPTEQFSDEVEKSDDEQRFYVTTNSHNLKDGDSFWYGPRRGNTVMSTGLRFDNQKNYRQRANYSQTAYAGDMMKLRGNSRTSDITSGALYQISVSGMWTP